ncbi:MAG: hypothetical protein PHU31_04085 [Anaerotignum sp.]|nr:hypothetical protein [Anaerotignum sp.]
MKKFMHILVSMAVMASAFQFSVLSVCAEENIVPDYEVKLLLDSDFVLNSDDLLKKTYRNLFETGTNYDEIGVLYIDTEDLAFNEEGWINRVRIKEDGDDFDLTYKKRYAIQNEDIESALDLANTEGFDITDTNYEAQIDWGYEKMTLSLSCNKTASNSGYDDMELPGKNAAIEMLKDKMPGKLEDWSDNNWGKDTIEDGKKFGPIYYLKYRGEYNNTDIDIEIWPIYNEETEETEYITELSFKADTYGAAEATRAALISYLDGLDILLHSDSLKTQKILSSY